MNGTVAWAGAGTVTGTVTEAADEAGSGGIFKLQANKVGNKCN